MPAQTQVADLFGHAVVVANARVGIVSGEDGSDWSMNAISQISKRACGRSSRRSAYRPCALGSARQIVVSRETQLGA